MKLFTFKRPQFSLMAALVTTAVFSIIFGIFGYARYSAGLRNAASDHLKKQGITVFAKDDSNASPGLFAYLWNDPYKTSEVIHVNNSELSENDGRLLRRFPNIDYVSIRNTNLSTTRIVLTNIAHPNKMELFAVSHSAIDSDLLAELRRFNNLETLAFLKCDMTAVDFSMLPVLPNMKHLRFGFSQGVDDSDVATLAGRLGPKVVFIDVNDTELSDKGLAILCGIASLEKLDVSNTRVNGSGLAALNEISSLKEIDLSNTQIQPDNLKHLLRLKTDTLSISLLDTSIRRSDAPEVVSRWGAGNLQIGSTNTSVSTPDANGDSDNPMEASKKSPPSPFPGPE